MDIFRLLRFLSETFNSLNIPYMLSGSVAMNFYTVSRATMDIDLVVHLEVERADVFLSGLHDFYFNKNTVIQEIRRKGMFNIIDNNTGIKVDIILLKNNKYSLQSFNRRVLLNDPGFNVFVISIEDLIIAKLMWIQQLFSERQVSDIRNLMKNEVKDTAYIEFWCSELKLNTFNLI